MNLSHAVTEQRLAWAAHLAELYPQGVPQKALRVVEPGYTGVSERAQGYFVKMAGTGEPEAGAAALYSFWVAPGGDRLPSEAVLVASPADFDLSYLLLLIEGLIDAAGCLRLGEGQLFDAPSLQVQAELVVLAKSKMAAEAVQARRGRV